MPQRKSCLTVVIVILTTLISIISPAIAADQGAAVAAPVKSEVRYGEWQAWAPRPEISPAFARQEDAMEIRSTGDAAAYGGWRCRIEGVKPGSHYRFVAQYRADGLKDAEFHVTARLQWLDSAGQHINPSDYALETKTEGGWTQVELLTPSPAKAAAAQVELGLRWSDSGKVTWKGARLLEESPPAARQVRIATVGYRPSSTGSAEASVEKFCQFLRAMKGEVDLICLPEGVSVIGSGKTYADVAEPIPGPLSEKLSAVAKEKRSYMVAGLYEREGKRLYNTAILLDREGRLVGKYRKAHLPQGEAEGGLTPGNEYPVFDTDFGKLGILICWDSHFPEPWRALALKQAEIIAMPIWGGNETLAKARAIENHIYLVTASFDMSTFIVDPTGAVLAESKPRSEQPVARATIDLNRIILQLPWLGNMKPTTWKERRADLATVKP